MEDNGQQPAFPLSLTDAQFNAAQKLLKETGGHLEMEGLSKREYFAAMAMQGIMTKDYVKLHIDGKDEKLPTFTNIKMIAEMSLAIADELLNQLNK